jgi:hypothetical protein
LLVEPDAKVVQGHSRRQPSPQTLKLMGSLPPEAEGVEELVIGVLHDLADACDPPPQAFGPASLAGVAFGRMDDLCPVTFEPPSVVLGSLEALVGYVGSRASRAHADEFSVRVGSEGEEGFRHLLVGCGSSSEAEAGYDPGRVDGGEQAKALIPPQTVGPSDVCTTGQPSMPSTLTVSDRHRRAIQSFVRRPLGVQQSDQVHDESFDELRVGAHEAVELRAIWQGGKSVAQAGPCVAVEVPLAREASPPSEDSQGDHLACAEGRLRTWLLCRQMGVAEVVDHNVKCGEEGVHVEHEGSVPFPSGSGSRPTLVRGHLPLKSSIDNSHQAFKAEEHAASGRRDGKTIGFEIVSKYVSAELAYVVQLEHLEAKVGGREDITPYSLRSTMIFRPDDGEWRVVHRHADPITTAQPAESVIQE